MFPADSIASTGKNSSAARTFDESSKRILVVDEWEAGIAGNSPSKVRVSSKATVKELVKATGIDLTKSIGATPAKKINNTLIDILTQTVPKKVGCLIFKELDTGGFTIVKTGSSILTMVLVPRLQALNLAQGERYIDAVLVSSSVRPESGYPRNYDLELIKDYTQNEFRKQYYYLTGGYQQYPAQAFSLPKQSESGEQIEFGGSFYNAAGSNLLADPSFPALPRFLTFEGEYTNSIITVRPSNDSDVLLMDIDGETFTLACTTNLL